jgi:hypothetical protein
MAAAFPLIVLAVLMIIDACVYSDARAHAQRGSPVILSIGSLSIDTPAAWFIECLLLSVLKIPAYLASR